MPKTLQPKRNYSKRKKSRTPAAKNLANDAGQVFRRWNTLWTLGEMVAATVESVKKARSGAGAKEIIKTGMAPIDERISSLPKDVLTAYSLGSLAVGLLNHPEWYENVLGNPIDEFQPGGINFVRDKAAPTVKSYTSDSIWQDITSRQTTSNIVTISTIATSGISGQDDAIGIRTACEKIMQTITAESGRVPNYTWEMVARYIWVHRKLNILMAEAVRAYEFAQFYSVLDSELPTGYSASLGIDLSDIQNNFASMREYMTFIARGAMEAFPMIDLPIFAQEWWYYGNVFADYPGPQATWIVHINARQDTPQLKTWAMIKNEIDLIMADFRSNIDRTLISDLIRVYGSKMYNSALYDMISYRLTDNSSMPFIVVDPDQLVAIQNATIFRRAFLSLPLTSSGSQSGPSLVWEYIYPEISMNAYGVISSAVLRPEVDLQLNTSGSGVRTVPISFIEDVDYGDHVTITDPYDRGTLGISQEISLCKSTPTVIKSNTKLLLTSCGSHIMIDARVYVRELTEDNMVKEWKGYPFGGNIVIQVGSVEWPDLNIQESNYITDLLASSNMAIHEMLDVIRCNKDVDYSPKYNLVVYSGNYLVNQTSSKVETCSGNVWDYTKFALVPNDRIESYHGLEVAALYTPKEYAYNMYQNAEQAKRRYNSSNG